MSALQPLSSAIWLASPVIKMTSAIPQFAKNSDEKGEVCKYIHPSLKIDPKLIVPIDLKFGSISNSIAISGPNMCGKSIAAEGRLIAPMFAQGGIPLSCSYAYGLPLGRKYEVLAPNADQVDGSYGYFESTLKKFTEIAKVAGPGDHIMIDEIPTGTDYDELVAISTVLIEDLINTGASVTVCTHLKRVLHILKERGLPIDFEQTDFALNEDGSITPKYKLKKGIATRSYGIELLKEVGFSDEFLNKTRDFYSQIVGLEIEKAQVEKVKKKSSHQSSTNPQRKIHSDQKPYQKYINDVICQKNPFELKVVKNTILSHGIGNTECKVSLSELFEDPLKTIKPWAGTPGTTLTFEGPKERIEIDSYLKELHDQEFDGLVSEVKKFIAGTLRSLGDKVSDEKRQDTLRSHGVPLFLKALEELRTSLESHSRAHPNFREKN